MLPASIALIAVYSAGSAWLSIEDFRHRSVRNADLFALVVATAISVLWYTRQAGENWSVSALAGLAYFLLYALIGTVSRGQLGSADYWGAGILGMFLGALRPDALLVGWAMPFALAFVPALVLYRRGGTGQFAFLPFVFGSVPVTILLHDFSAGA